MSGLAAAKGEFARGWPVVLSSMLGIGLGLSPVPFYTLGIFAPHLHEAFGWSFAEIFGALTMTTAAVVLFSPLVGLLVERFGVRPIALISVLLFGLSFTGFYFSNGSLVLYYANWALVATLGAGTLPITWTRAVNNWFDKEKGLALGLCLVGTGLFGIIGTRLTNWLVDSYGWREAFLALGALPLLIALPVGYFGFRDVGDRKETSVQRRASDAARRAATPGLTAGQAFANWRFWVIALAFVPVAFSVGGIIPNMLNILQLEKFSKPEVVSLASLIGWAVIFGRVVGGFLVDRFWAPGVAVVLLGIPAGAYWMLAHGHAGYTLTAVYVFLVGIAAGIEYDLMAFLIARYLGMKSYGVIYGAIYSFFAFGAGVGPPVYGWMYDHYKSYTLPLSASSGLIIVGALSLLLLGRYRTFEPDA
jgi:predicted MFS family arabinose efflux permease